MNEPLTLPFETFWNWLATHPNCILRAGTPETVLYDDEDLHWHFALEGGDTMLVQVLRGKRLMGEILVQPDQVTYVQGTPGETDEEYVFELISEAEANRVSSYFFVLSHTYEEGSFSEARVH